MDVGVWLRSLGLGRYEVAFSENSIDADVLPDLTDSDLEKLGVTLGHRKRLLKAIAALGTAEVTAKPSSPASASSPAGVAERRPMTVMFCDLVGSTSLAAKLDAEDWRDLVGAYLDAASEAVTGFGGHVLMIERVRKRLSKTKKGFRGWPLATVALYGPDDSTATKLTVGIVPAEDAEATDLRRWFSKEQTDIRDDIRVTEEVLAFITEAGAKSVVMTERIIGCPHEEGADYEGAACPACLFWAGRDRWTGKRLH